MRASRLLSIQMLLQTRGRMSAAVLAAELEVAPRTILRDIDQLCAAGVPVWAERGSQGGFQLQAGWRTQLTGLTDKEAQALFLAGLPAAATQLGLGHESATAQLKVLASLPQALQADAQRVSERLHVDTVDWFRSSTPPRHLQAVAAAVWHQQTIQMRYESWSKTAQRQVKPLGLVLKAGVWYLVAQAAAGRGAGRNVDAQARTYRLSNILELELLSTRFERPLKFQLPEFWQATTRRFETEIYTATAKLRFSDAGRKALVQISPAIEQAVLRELQSDPARRGWSRAEIPIESVEHATHQLLGLGAQVQVLEPAALRNSIKQTLREMAKLYR